MLVVSPNKVHRSIGVVLNEWTGTASNGEQYHFMSIYWTGSGRVGNYWDDEHLIRDLLIVVYEP